MADLSRNRSIYREPRGTPLGRSLWTLTKLLIAIAFIAGGAYLIISTVSSGPIAVNSNYTVVNRQVIAGELYRDHARLSELGYARTVAKPARYLLICQGNTTRQTTVFEVSRREYENSHNGLVYSSAETAGWRRFGSIADARRTFDEEFTAPAPPAGKGGDKDDSSTSDVIENARRLLGL